MPGLVYLARSRAAAAVPTSSARLLLARSLSCAASPFASAAIDRTKQHTRPTDARTHAHTHSSTHRTLAQPVQPASQPASQPAQLLQVSRCRLKNSKLQSLSRPLLIRHRHTRRTPAAQFFHSPRTTPAPLEQQTAEQEEQEEQEEQQAEEQKDTRSIPPLRPVAFHLPFRTASLLQLAFAIPCQFTRPQAPFW